MDQKTGGELLDYGPGVGIDEVNPKSPVIGTRPETELLLYCARTYIDSESAERIKALLQEDINWAYLIQKAIRHGVMPLLYRSLYTTCPETLHPAILDKLSGYFYTNAWRNHFLAEELLKLLNLFDAHKISVIPYKGPVLAASVYGNLSLRQFGDLDILVHKQDVSRARNLLISQGYRPKNQKQTSAQQVASFQVRHEFTFVRDDGKVQVDLHWGIIEKFFSFPLGFDHLWKRSEPVSLAGTTVLTLSPEDLLLVLCAHGSKPTHRWQRLIWICDIAELIHVHHGLDWKQVLARAKRLGSERRLFLGLYGV